MSAGPWDSLIVGAGAEAVRIRRMDALDFYGRGTVAVQPGAQVEVVLRSDYLTALAQCDAARDIAARLEAQLAAVADLHRPQPIYDECERDCPDHGIPLNYYTGCPDRIIAMACRHCCLDANGDQTEDCATYHDHTEHTCPTAAALAIPDDDADPNEVITVFNHNLASEGGDEA